MVYNSIDFWHAQYSWASSRFITYGLTEESIEIHDPMPDRGLFDVTRDVFGYTVRGKTTCFNRVLFDTMVIKLFEGVIVYEVHEKAYQ